MDARCPGGGTPNGDVAGGIIRHPLAAPFGSPASMPGDVGLSGTTSPSDFVAAAPLRTAAQLATTPLCSVTRLPSSAPPAAASSPQRRRARLTTPPRPTLSSGTWRLQDHEGTHVCIKSSGNSLDGFRETGQTIGAWQREEVRAGTSADGKPGIGAANTPGRRPTPRPRRPTHLPMDRPMAPPDVAPPCAVPGAVAPSRHARAVPSRSGAQPSADAARGNRPGRPHRDGQQLR